MTSRLTQIESALRPLSHGQSEALGPENLARRRDAQAHAEPGASKLTAVLPVAALVRPSRPLAMHDRLAKSLLALFDDPASRERAFSRNLSVPVPCLSGPLASSGSVRRRNVGQSACIRSHVDSIQTARTHHPSDSNWQP